VNRLAQAVRGIQVIVPEQDQRANERRALTVEPGLGEPVVELPAGLGQGERFRAALRSQVGRFTAAEERFQSFKSVVHELGGSGDGLGADATGWRITGQFAVAAASSNPLPAGVISA
jgi:hypothetical protein